MEYQHIHNIETETVYRFPKNPKISTKCDISGNIITFTITMEIEITRADNKLVGSRWKYPVSDYPQQIFENIGDRYNNDLVTLYFHRNHDPQGVVIDEKLYEKLKEKYLRKRTDA